MTINEPDVLAEVTAVFLIYETALVTNDVDTLDTLFWNSPHTLRYGGGENLYGYDEIAAFRAGRSPAGSRAPSSARSSRHTGAILRRRNTLFRRDNAPGKFGRQSQTWLRTPEGWKVVAAHVSIIGEM